MTGIQFPQDYSIEYRYGTQYGGDWLAVAAQAPFATRQRVVYALPHHTARQHGAVIDQRRHCGAWMALVKFDERNAPVWVFAKWLSAEHTRLPAHDELTAAQYRLEDALETQRGVMERFRRVQARELMHFQPLNAAGNWGKLTYYDRQTLKRGLSGFAFWDKAKVHGIEPRFNVLGSHSPSPVGAEHAVQLAERELAFHEMQAHLKRRRADSETRRTLAHSYAQLTSLLASELHGRDMSAKDAALLALDTILPQAAATAAYVLGDEHE